MNEYDEFEATLRDAGWSLDEIEMAWTGQEDYRERLINAVIEDGERDLCASAEDYA